MFGPHYFEFTDKSLVKGGERYYIYIRDSTTNKGLCQGWWKFNFDGDNNKSFATYFYNDANIGVSCLGEPNSNQIILITGGMITKLTKNQFWSTHNINYRDESRDGSNKILNFKFERYEN